MNADLQKLEQQIEAENITILLMPKINYSDRLMDILKLFSEHRQKICYVSANRPAKSLMKQFEAFSIDANKFKIIDCISDSVTQTDKRNASVYFIGSPKNLTELSIVLAKSMQEGAENIFVDALSTFVIYQDSITVVRFTHNLISKLRSDEKNGIFVVLKDEISNVLLSDLSMFVDNVIDGEN